MKTSGHDCFQEPIGEALHWQTTTCSIKTNCSQLKRFISVENELNQSTQAQLGAYVMTTTVTDNDTICIFNEQNQSFLHFIFSVRLAKTLFILLYLIAVLGEPTK